LEINRPGIAVTDRTDGPAAGLAHLAEGALDVGEGADVERDLLHHRRLEIGLAPRHEHHLVMVAGVAAQKGDAAVGCGIADDEAEDARGEVLRLRQVADVEPDMAQARRYLVRHERLSLTWCSLRHPTGSSEASVPA